MDLLDPLDVFFCPGLQSQWGALARAEQELG